MPEPRSIGPVKPERHRALRRHHADVDGALLPDAVVGEQRFVFVDALREALGEGLDEIEQRALARARSCGRRPSACATSTPGTSASSPAGRDTRRPDGSRWHACACPRPPRSSPSGLRARLNASRNTVIAPMSSACAPSHIRWFRMRVTSSNITRMYCARTGTVDAQQRLDGHARRRARCTSSTRSRAGPCSRSTG